MSGRSSLGEGQVHASIAPAPRRAGALAVTLGLRQSFPAGTEIFHSGDLGDCAYLIDEGEVEITIPVGAAGQVVNRLGPGELFGEMALIDGSRRSGAARAVSDTVTRVFTSGQLQARLRGGDEIIAFILRITLLRYRQTLDHVRRSDDPTVAAEFASGPVMPLDARLAVMKLDLENELRLALDGGELRLFYQPVVDLRDGRLHGFEALIRWENPRRGLMPPGEFIPLAEETGLVVPMCRWALLEAASALGRFHQAARGAALPLGRRLAMSVNITKHQLDDPETLEILDAIAAGGVIDPGELKLEFTETVLMNDHARAQRWIAMLRERRFRVSIDDFGTGYSSLGYLNQFTVDEVKIDQSFVAVMMEDARSLQIVRAIVGLARALGLTTVAEGVETGEQAAFLRQIGCDLGQGYRYARALPEAEALGRLQAGDLDFGA